MARVILKDRGQITIPAKLRKTLALRPGDVLEVEVEGGHIVLKPLHVVERQAERPDASAEEPAG